MDERRTVGPVATTKTIGKSIAISPAYGFVEESKRQSPYQTSNKSVMMALAIIESGTVRTILASRSAF
jgi:hypothetical protein